MMNKMWSWGRMAVVAGAIGALGLTACGGGGGGGEGGGSSMTTGSGVTTGSSMTTGSGVTTGSGMTTGSSMTTGSGMTTSSGGSTGSGQPFSWQGTWNVHLVYSGTCQWSGLGAPKPLNADHINAMTINVDGTGGLLADVMGYELQGTGNESSLTISGQYPLHDDQGKTSSNDQNTNNVTIAIDTVADDKHATGTLSGQFEGEFGQLCKISSGTVAMSR